MKKLDNFINFARNKTKTFVYSKFLPVLICLVTLLFWVLDWQMVGFGILVAIACFLLLTYDDFLPVIPLLFMIPMCFRDSAIAFQRDFTASIILFAVLFVFFIIHFIKYPLKKLVVDNFFFVTLLVFATLLLTGVFAGKFEHYFDALDIMLISGAMPVVIHFLLTNKINFSTNINHRRYFCVCLLSAISLSCLQLLLACIKIKFYFNEISGSVPGAFCWTNSNNIASLCLLAIPVCLYLMISSKNWWIYLAVLILSYACIYISGSDGVLATILCFTPFLLILFYKHSHVKTKKYLGPLYIILFSVATLLLAYIVLFNLENGLAYFKRHSSGTGRVYPYTFALENFLQYPLFGLGLGEGKYALDNTMCDIYNVSKIVYNGFYHSTFMHILACCGIVGIAVYVLYYIKRIKLLGANDTVLGKFALFAFAMFAVYSMIDTNEFNIVLLYMTTMITVIGSLNKKGNGDKPLPLVYERKKLSFINNVSRN